MLSYLSDLQSIQAQPHAGNPGSHHHGDHPLLLPWDHRPTTCSGSEFRHSHYNPDIHLYSNDHPDTDFHSHLHSDDHRHSNRHTFSQRYFNTHVDRDAHTHLHAKRNPNPYSNIHIYAHIHIHRHPHKHADDTLIQSGSSLHPMTEITPFLKDLLNVPGLSGYEDPAFEIISAKWEPLVHEISRGRLGSLHGLRRGTGVTTTPDTGPRLSVMIATHMDAVGLMVTGITDGFLRLTNIGGVDPRILPGTPVTVHATRAGGQQPIPGVVVLPHSRLLPPEIGSNTVPLEYLFVDTGLPPGKVNALVNVGDVVSFAQEPVELSGETIAGHSLDNRASVAALTVCLEELQSRPHVWDVWAVATTQEEIGFIGATGSTFELRPTIAIVVDVTFGKGPGANDWQTLPLGKGPTLCIGPNIHPAMHKEMKVLADRLEIPYVLEYAPLHTDTDSFATQVTAEGIPTLVMAIPLRYMHTPVEVAAIKDIQRAGRLMAEFIAGLSPDFMEKITWDD